MMMMMRWHFDNTYLNQNKKAGNENSINMAKPLFVIICIFPLKILIIFDGLDLVSKEIIENNFNDKKEIKANI